MKRIFFRICKLIDYFFIGFSYLASKRLVAVLVVLLFLSLIQVSTGFREELLLKEQDMMYENVDSGIKSYTEKEFASSNKGPAALILEECYKRGLDVENNLEIQNLILELEAFFSSQDMLFSFLYQDLYTGFTVSYNEESSIFTASTIKAPAMIYFYEQASLGRINLDEKLLYDGSFYSEGSGVLKTKEKGTSYSVLELIQYAIHDSDNIAYAMLMNRYGREEILKFWQDKGTKNIFTLDTIWGVTSARDAAIYMRELYQFYLNDDVYGEQLMNYFKEAEWKMITNMEGEFNTANKGGWSNQTFHDVAIVFEENPYILVVMSEAGEANYLTLFQEVSRMVGKLHDTYWKYKEDTCGQIHQY